MNRQTVNKKKKPNQTVYVAAVAVLTVVSAIIAVIGAEDRKSPDTPPARQTETAETAKTEAPSTENAKTTVKPTTADITKEPLEEPDTSCAETMTEDEPVAVTLPDFTLPVYGTVLKHHSSDMPVFSETMNDYRIHNGIDVEAAAGDAVYSVADGVVSAIWDDPMMGKCISVSHAADAVSIYKNLAAELADGIAVGAKVASGQIIGAVGDTALIELADESHLHYELTIAGAYVNPEEYIDFTRAVISYGE